MASYQTFKEILKENGIDSSPSEVQGLQFGVLCGGETDLDACLERVIESWDLEEEPSANCLQCMDEVLDEMDSYLAEAMEEDLSEKVTFELPLFLPDESVSLSEQANALSCWCKGLLYGLGVSGADVDAIRSDEVREALFDIAEIAKMPPVSDSLEKTDEDEDHFQHICEYLKVAAMMIYFELLECRQADSDTPPTTEHTH